MAEPVMYLDTRGPEAARQDPDCVTKMDPSTNKLIVAPLLDGPEDYHVYIPNSESDEDRHLVEKIITPLKTMRFRLIDPGSFYPKDEYDLTKVENGVMRSKHVLILLTKAFLAKSELLTLVHKTSERKAGENRDGWFLIIALGDVTEDEIPEELRGYKNLTVGNANFEAELCQILANTTTPEMAVLPVGGIAKGLAWSYWYGYLQMLLPGLPERYRQFGVWKDPAGERVMPLKMFILIPATCYCPPKLTDVDEKLLLHNKKIPFKATRAGCKERNYDATVYYVKDDDGQCYYVQIEFATPVLSIWEMYEDGIAGMREQEKNHQLLLFYDVLRDILNHDRNKACRDKAVLLYYDDSDTSNKVPLSRIVLDRITLEIARDLEQEREMQTAIEVYDAEAKRGEKPTYNIERSVIRLENDLSQKILPRYDMQLTSQNRGIALIISVATYKPPEFTNRDGAKIDDDKLIGLWTDLGFTVKIVRNPTGKVIMRTATRLAMEDHTNYEAFVCCIHSHGDLGVVFGSDGKQVKITDITHLFSEEVSESLANKPKMFFIQACQGRKEPLKKDMANPVDKQEPLKKDMANPVDKQEDKNQRAKLVPSSKDFLMSYATLPGSVSYRHTARGTYYIDSLDKNIRELRNQPGMEMDRILKKVSRDVENEMKQEEVPKAQYPFHLATMNKLLYL